MVNRGIKEMIAQMIMIGFKEAEVADDTPVVRAIRGSSLGGVVLYNIELKCFLKEQQKNPALTRFEGAKICPKNVISREQLKALTSELKGYSRIPLLIAADQEGGEVLRLGPAAGFPERESPKVLGGKDDVAETAATAEGMAMDLKQNGINLNLAPVVDLNLNPEAPVARNGRSFGDNPQLVYRHAQVFIEAHRKHGVFTTLKHFPGKGSIGKDTHYEIADVTDSYQEQEVYPFSRLIEEGWADLIMTSHIHHRGWDEKYPVTLSSKVLRGLLREKLGFRGVIISDDLQMGAIGTQFTLEDACILAVQAGVDILMASNNSPEGDDPQLFSRIFESLVRGAEQGRISQTMIEASHGRLMELKKRLAKG